MQKSHHGTIEIEWHKQKKNRSISYASSKDCHQAHRGGIKSSQRLSKGHKITNAQNVVDTPKKKAPVGCILSSMAPSNGVRGGEERCHKSLSNIPKW